MRYYKGMPVGLWLLAISNILFTIYYYIRPLLLGADLSLYEPMLTLTPWGFVMWLNNFLEIIEIYAVTFGFYYRKNWARLYTIAFTCFSAFWTLYFLFYEKVWPYERFTWLVYYVIIIVYLLMSDIQDYFVPGKNNTS